MNYHLVILALCLAAGAEALTLQLTAERTCMELEV